jgi:hypothetical protein
MELGVILHDDHVEVACFLGRMNHFGEVALGILE